MFCLMKEAGVRWVRIPVYWSQVQFSSGDGYHFEQFDSSSSAGYDDIMRKAGEYGINVLAILMGGYEPFFVPKCPGDWTAGDYEKWGKFIGSVAERYRPGSGFWNGGSYGVTHWQIWNEPSYKMYWGRPYASGMEAEMVDKSDAESYAELLMRSSRELKKCYSNPSDCKIVTGGIVTSEEEHYRYWERLYDYSLGKNLGAGDMFDIIGINFYRYPGENNLDYYISVLRNGLGNGWKGLRYFNDAGREIWITEIGWPSDPQGNLDTNGQVQYLAQVFGTAQGHNIGNVFWFCFRNGKEEGNRHWGLVEANLVKTKMFEAYRQLTSDTASFLGRNNRPRAALTSVKTFGFRGADAGINTRPVGSLNTLRDAQAVSVKDGYAYIADGGGGLKIADVSNPKKPVVISSCAVNGTVYDVCVYGNYAYAAANAAGLIVIDISNPARPVIVSSCDTPGSAEGIFVNGRHAYLADGSYLRIFDISNPFSPKQAGSLYCESWVGDVRVEGRYLYFADTRGLKIADISDPARPFIAGSCNISLSNSCSSLKSSDIIISGKRAYVANRQYSYSYSWRFVTYGNYHSGFSVMDISNPSAPVELYRYYNSCSYSDSSARLGISVSGGYVFFADGSAGVRVLSEPESSAPEQLALLSAYSTGVFAGGNRVYTAGYAAMFVYEFDGRGAGKSDVPVIYPNPCTDISVPVTFRDVSPCEKADIYTFSGDLVARIGREKTRGVFTWDQKNGAGDFVADGTYICVITRKDGRKWAGKFALIR
ncbi:MAG: hypothetical protein A2297_03765 [Elusimicrobia bacterium RIFOXYB2_FULL_48_7]|nr:MAG: hypothetical protein A2297_03765 [Elusimicrobia bacterium RIFOXYB2_FULL_48_7]